MCWPIKYRENINWLLSWVAFRSFGAMCKVFCANAPFSQYQSIHGSSPLRRRAWRMTSSISSSYHRVLRLTNRVGLGVNIFELVWCQAKHRNGPAYGILKLGVTLESHSCSHWADKWECGSTTIPQDNCDASRFYSSQQPFNSHFDIS